jgi:hypothetical protein
VAALRELGSRMNNYFIAALKENAVVESMTQSFAALNQMVDAALSVVRIVRSQPWPVPFFCSNFLEVVYAYGSSTVVQASQVVITGSLLTGPLSPLTSRLTERDFLLMM